MAVRGDGGSFIELQQVAIHLPLPRSVRRRRRKGLEAQGTAMRAAPDGAGRKRMPAEIRALDGVDLRLQAGDRLGIMGLNGSGKTTLLKVMGGIYEPTGGRVVVEGRISSLYDLRAGMDRNASGYENVFLRGLLMGLRPRQIETRLEAIVDLADLADFIHLPLYTYSSGMAVRLAVATTLLIEPEILLMDEWIGMGDKRFTDRIEAMVTEKVASCEILALASHSETLLRDICNRGLVLEAGRVAFDGPLDAALAYYFSEEGQKPARRRRGSVPQIANEGRPDD